jgi:hypothetical protein
MPGTLTTGKSSGLPEQATPLQPERKGNAFGWIGSPRALTGARRNFLGPRLASCRICEIRAAAAAATTYNEQGSRRFDSDRHPHFEMSIRRRRAEIR